MRHHLATPLQEEDSKSTKDESISTKRGHDPRSKTLEKGTTSQVDENEGNLSRENSNGEMDKEINEKKKGNEEMHEHKELIVEHEENLKQKT